MRQQFRLSDEQLTDLVTDAGTSNERLGFVAREAVYELRERRRNDLADEDLAELIAVREQLSTHTEAELHPGLRVLDKLIRDGQVKKRTT